MLLVSLPSELITSILFDLQVRDLLRCREICRKFKALIDGDVCVQYKLELAVSGMQDGLSSPLTPVERLSTLHARQKAWNEFEWTAKEDVPMRQGYGWQLSGNVLAQTEGERTLHFKQIPSATRGIEGTEWTIPDVGCRITGFGMDPAQDLLVVIEHFWDQNSELMYRIHLKALSNGAPHPAGPPEGMLTPQSKPRSYSCSIKISGKHLGVLIACTNSKELLVWDWKFGTLQLASLPLFFMHLTGREIRSWAFLTSRLLLVAKAHSQYNEQTGCTVYIPHLAIIDLERHAPSASASPGSVSLCDTSPVCTFHFPPLAHDVVTLDMVMQSDPRPTDSENVSPNSLPVPFSLSDDPEHRLFLVSLCVIRRLMDEVVLRVLVPASTFLHVLSKSTLGPPVTPGGSATQTQRDFTWAEWGERGARFFVTPSEGSPALSEACYVHGTVFATTQMDSDPDTDAPDGDGRVRRSVTVRDFNQLALRRRAHAAAAADSKSEPRPAEEQNVRVVMNATVLTGAAGVFKEEVTTSLPYAERVLVLSEPEGGQDDASWDAAIPTEDALVLATSMWIERFRCRILSI